MKKLILGLLFLFVVGLVDAALVMNVNPAQVDLPDHGTAYTTISVCQDAACTKPVPNRGLAVLIYCKEDGGDPLVCDTTSELAGTSDIDVSVESPTDLLGQAQVTIEHLGPGIGLYHYTICDAQTGLCDNGGASVTGDAFIPEFTVFGAGLILVGAALFIKKKR